MAHSIVTVLKTKAIKKEKPHEEKKK